MTEARSDRLLHGYALGRLSPEELRELSAAALDDDAVFARMAEADEERRILSDPATRQEALRIVQMQLRTAPSFLENLLAFVRKPLVLTPLVAGAAALVALSIYLLRSAGPTYIETDGPALKASNQAARVARLSSSGQGPSLEIRASVPVPGGSAPQGSPISAEIELRTTASVVAVQRLPDGTARFVFPAERSESAVLPPGRHRLAFDASPPGSFRAGAVILSILAASPDVDLRLQNTDLAAARKQLTVQTIQYALSE